MLSGCSLEPDWWYFASIWLIFVLARLVGQTRIIMFFEYFGQTRSQPRLDLRIRSVLCNVFKIVWVGL